MMQMLYEGGVDALMSGPAGEYDEYDDEEAEMRRRRKLDEHFATLYAEFDDENLGELHQEDLEGGVEFKDYEDMLDSTLSANQRRDKRMLDLQTKEVLKKKILEECKRLQEEEARPIEELEREIRAMTQPKKTEKWDCESILSTYSNHSNHPSLIKEPKRRAKQIKLNKHGIAVEGLPERKHHDDHLEQVDEDQEGEGEGYEDDDEEGDYEPKNLGERRPRKETKAERKARKAAAKELRRQARARKRGTKALFKTEKTIAARNKVNNQVANPAGMKLS